LLLNGHRLNIYDGSSVGNDLGLNMMNLEEVEIIRGPGSALYGTNAMFGVINLKSKIINNISEPEIKATYGSFNTKSVSANLGGEILKDISFSLNSSIYDSDGENIYFKEFDTPENNNGIAENLDYENYFGINGIIQYKKFALNGFSSNRKKGNPTGSFYSIFNEFSETIEETKFLNASFNHEFSFDKQFSINAFYEQYNHLGNYLVSYDIFNMRGIVQNDVKTVGSDIQLIWDLLPNDRLTVGSEYREDLDRKFIIGTDDFDLINKVDKNKIFSIFIQNEYQFTKNLMFYAGVRRDDYFGGINAINP